jgi:hypothetical protein
VQSIFARYMLFDQLLDHGLPQQVTTAFGLNSMTLPWTQAEVAHRMLWADNADAISRLYAGTPALKGDFTRTGKRTKLGALDDGMNSLQRYYLNNFMDADRQEGMDLLVGHRSFGLGGLVPLGSKSTNILSHDGVSIQDAARRALLGGRWHDTIDQDDDVRHVRIKQSKMRKQLVSRRRKLLDLRWLPGDLQTQVRSLAASSIGDLYDAETPGSLQAMDKRAASNLPWWVVDSDDTGDESREKFSSRETEIINSGGFLFGAVLAGTQSPVAMAAVVLALLSATFPPLSDQRASS